MQRGAGGKRCFEGSLLSGFFPNSNCFGVFSHSKGFGEESLSDSLWYSGADPSWAAKGFHKVPPRFQQRFHQGSSKGAARFFKFRGVCGSLAQIRGSAFQGSVEGSPRFHRGSPITSLNWSPSSSTLFCIFPNSVSFRVFSHSKGLGAK